MTTVKFSEIEISEIERAAITLLHQARPNHPALRAWIQALGTNPDEMRHIDDFIISAKLHEYEPFIYFPATDWFEPETFAERLQEAGYTASTEKYDFENSVWKAIFDCRPLSEGDGRYQFSNGRHVARLDKLILILADALRDYRVSGRPNDTDQVVLK